MDVPGREKNNYVLLTKNGLDYIRNNGIVNISFRKIAPQRYIQNILFKNWVYIESITIPFSHHHLVQLQFQSTTPYCTWKIQKNIPECRTKTQFPLFPNQFIFRLCYFVNHIISLRQLFDLRVINFIWRTKRADIMMESRITWPKDLCYLLCILFYRYSIIWFWLCLCSYHAMALVSKIGWRKVSLNRGPF